MSSLSSIAKDHDEPTTASGDKNNAPSKEQASDIDTPAVGEIDAADEVKGVKLALVIFGLCFSNILTGLVG
jgi:hypothetical protein